MSVRHQSYRTGAYNNSLLWTHMLMRHESYEISVGVVTTTTIELWFGHKLFYALWEA